MARTGPSLSGAFDILGAAGQDKLLYLKHKLKTVHQGCRGADLLYAMVLLKLGQETEARISLEALRADAVARLVARRWAGVDSAEAPEEPPDLSWAIARVYHLLAEEKLCPAPVRDLAYQTALQTFSSRDDHRLAELQGEARDRCGWGVIRAPGSFQPLRSDRGCLPPSSVSPSGTRSLPKPIEGLSGWSRGCSLRSTSSPASLASNLEISQSPTMPLLSQHRGCRAPSKLCEEPRAGPGPEPEPAPTGCQEPEEVSWPPSEEAVNPSPGDTAGPPSGVTAGPLLGETAGPSSEGPSLEDPSSGETAGPPMAPDSPGPRLPEVVPDASATGQPDAPKALESGTRYPVECSHVLAAPASLPLPPKTTCPDKDQTPLSLPVEDTASRRHPPCPPTPSAPRTSAPCPSPSIPPSACSAAWNPCPPPPELEPEQKFYNFVILHAGADEDIALRVRERLESLGVPDGATFCEDFQDALDHSAFTLLLLTPNFDCHLGLHQAGQSLMNSLTRHECGDCVIPFLPLESSLEQLSPHTRSLLTSLVWLDERSQIFARKPPAPPQSPGLQPLIIHHAQMVQLGLNNHMWNQRGTQAPEDKTQGAE
ncbi:tir domain-containing adapter molecule [Lynx pardinus]|uniref:TIR domain-containing adapter molecule 1 n=1 Tax=Lynx pardinus TaxID=191816 RepID=A0A485MGI7_LYNPA|nr:tir domain-containing adapter molecule [Lynx pardinus]